MKTCEKCHGSGKGFYYYAGDTDDQEYCDCIWGKAREKRVRDQNEPKDADDGDSGEVSW